MTAHDKDIPRRGDGTENRRLALNPDILKVIAGSIEAVSGHKIDSLLQPERERLEHTIYWALKRLHSMASEDESEYADSFPLLAQKLNETMAAIRDEE